MKYIHLGRDKFTVVDDEDYEKVSKYLWIFSQYGYARASSEEIKNLFMHRLLLGIPEEGYVIDHINRNKLDNRRSNLRFATHSMNVINRGGPSCSLFIPENEKREAVYQRKVTRKLTLIALIDRRVITYPTEVRRTNLVKKVINVTTNTEYFSVAEAARQLNLQPHHITECCNGKRSTHGGFVWKYHIIGPLG